MATDLYDDPTLHGLAAPAADAEALAGVLSDPDLGGFEMDVLRNPTSWETAQHVEALLGECHPSDLVLLHFSCHGLKDESGELFLAARNTTPTRLASTAVDTSLVNRLMQRSRAQRVVLLLDCCYGGAFERGVVARADPGVHVGDQFSQGRLGGGRGRVVITASSAMEYALEGTDLTIGGTPEPSLFTGALVNGLSSGEADRDQDGQVGLDELYEYVFEKVRARSPNQTPSKWEFGLQGDLVIARNPRRRIVAAPVNDDILALAQHPTPGVRMGAVNELAQVAAGADISRGAGAALLLREMLSDDSRRVAHAAGEAIAKMTPQVSNTAVSFGTVPVGTTSAEEIRVEGSPLALASTVETSGPPIHAHLTQSVLRIAITASTPGPLLCWVKLTGPAGEQRIDVTATITDEQAAEHDPQQAAVPGTPIRAEHEEQVRRSERSLATPPAATSSTSHAESTAPPLISPDSSTRTGPIGLLALGVVLAGAAIVAAGLLPHEHNGVRILARQNSGFVFVPAAALVLSLPGLFVLRARPVMIGVIAGSAAWAAGFWLKQTVSVLAALGPSATLDLWLRTGLWALTVASLLLSAAAYLGVKGSPTLRSPVMLSLSRRTLVGGLLVVAGPGLVLIVTLLDKPDSAVRVVTLTVLMVVTCLPVALTRFVDHQRLAARTAVTAFLIFTWGRDIIWVIATGSRNPHVSATVTATLLVLVGCYLGTSRPARPQQP